MHVPARARLRRVDIRVRVDPEHAAGAVDGRQPAERPERHRVVAAEDERDLARRSGLGDEPRNPLARLLDLREEARALVVQRGLLRLRARHIPSVAHLVPEAAKPLLEPRRTHRRRPHVDTAPALAEVERGPDDRHVSLRLLHGAERYAILSRRVAGTKDCWAGWIERMRTRGDPKQLERGAEMLAGFRERVLDNAGPIDDKTLLDVGCGEGLIAFGALERGPAPSSSATSRATCSTSAARPPPSSASSSTAVSSKPRPTISPASRTSRSTS